MGWAVENEYGRRSMQSPGIKSRTPAWIEKCQRQSYKCHHSVHYNVQCIFIYIVVYKKVYTVYRKGIAFTQNTDSEQVFTKMNVDVGISGEKSNRTRQG